MRGSPVRQIQTIWKESGINRIGSSKHDAKAKARAEGARTFAEIARETGIHSFRTADAYRDIWISCFRHARATTGVKDVELMQGSHVESFLTSLIHRAEGPITWATAQTYCSAISKFETALNAYALQQGTGHRYNFNESLVAAKAEAARECPRNENHRSYVNPNRLLSAIADVRNQLAARIQRESGIRVHDVGLIKDNQLRGIGTDPVTGRTCGVIYLESSKGGKSLEIRVSLKTYADLTDIIAKEHEFWIDKHRYRDDLKRAADVSEQAYRGSHGLRWNYARERMVDCQEAGMSWESALGQCARDMGHERPDITEHYLR